MSHARAIAAAAIAALLTLFSGPLGAADSGFSLDAVLSAPFADELTASPRRDALVWTVHERGARDVAVWKDGATREIRILRLRV